MVINRYRNWSLIAIGAAALLGTLLIVWQIFEARDETRIRPGATVSGIEIGGLEPQEAVTALEPVIREVADTVVELQFGDYTVTVGAAELGVSLDADETLADADNPAPPAVRPAAWLIDLFATREVTPSVAVDIAKLADTVDPYTDPETPRIELIDGAFRPVVSTDVPVPDMELLARRLQEAVRENPGGEVVVDVPVAGMEPADPVAVELAADLAAQANSITAGGVTLGLQGTPETFSIDEATLRSFIVLAGENHDARLALDPRIDDTLASLFVGIGDEGMPATFGLDEAGAVTITGGAAGFKCCHDSAAEAMLAGMAAGDAVVELPRAVVAHPRGLEWAESMGIIQLVAEFTTNFRAGEDRVINIARISELTRGVIIEPGEQFSVNDFVGRRTVANGFVPAGMILHGVFVDSVGGGISQYATTLFNAAFFAGLDFIDYQSHSIYLSRYPYGREATVSYPNPDLVLENNSPYGVMLWPTTGRSSITVRIYSTMWVTAEQTNQWVSTVGTSCTRVTTERTRTWLDDGHTETDRVGALYRPEGLRCDGTPSVTTTTTIPPTTSTTLPTEEGGSQGQGESGRPTTDTGQETPPKPASDDPDTGDDGAGGDGSTSDDGSEGSDNGADDGGEDTDSSGEGTTNTDDGSAGADGSTSDDGATDNESTANDGSTTNDGSTDGNDASTRSDGSAEGNDGSTGNTGSTGEQGQHRISNHQRVRRPQRRRDWPGRISHMRTVTSVVDAVDSAVDSWWERHLRGRPSLDRLMYAASEAANHSRLWHALGAAQTAARRDRRSAVGLSLALMCEAALVNGAIKTLFRRGRPEFEGERPHALRQPLTSSFPSGHASAAAVAASLLSRRSRWGAAYWALALVVALSRIHVRLHHASDVAAGLGIGIGLGAAFRRLLR